MEELAFAPAAVEAIGELDQVAAQVLVADAVEGAPQPGLEVRDDHVGPWEDLGRVRKAFFTRKRGGSGLGLAIAGRIVEAHRGRIELENLEPSGFEARVILPMSASNGKMGA